MLSMDALDDALLASLRQRVPGFSPPIYNHNGFQIPVHSGPAQRGVDSLATGVQMPTSWVAPTKHATRTELKKSRAAAMRPHASFDVDGDGFVGQVRATAHALSLAACLAI